jgi:glycosyltransferase involved in cell wall biosynthesis
LNESTASGMNLLFALYGDLASNSAIPLALHARELCRMGHHCAVALPERSEAIIEPTGSELRQVSYEEALASPESVFADGRPADLLHAWTPREGVRRFVTSYLARRPTPWVIYLEDNEGWLARASLALAGIGEDVLLQHTEEVLAAWTPPGMPHVLRYGYFIGLADAAVVIQDKLAVDIPPWVTCSEVLPGVDLEAFAPRAPDLELRRRYGLTHDEKVIVYPGGLNDFTRPGVDALCRAVGLINARGTRCRLLRSGPVPLDFLGRLPPDAAAAVVDLGPLPREEIPALLALADVFVQPGRSEPYEDKRLPGKLPEFFASGRPVVLPETNIAHLLRDGVDAVLHRTGEPEELAEKCLALFADPERAHAIGMAGRRFAESHFDPRVQARRLEQAHRNAIEAFDATSAVKLWQDDSERTGTPELLVRRLRLLAQSGGRPGAPPEMLEAVARSVELARARARGLEAAMAVRDGEIASLRRSLEQADVRAAALGGAVAELRRTAEDAQQRAHALGLAGADLRAQLGAVKASFSWRITRPLRWLGAAALRLGTYLRG